VHTWARSSCSGPAPTAGRSALKRPSTWLSERRTRPYRHRRQAGDRHLIALPDDDQQRLLAEPGTGPFGPQERPMAGYVTIPANWLADTADDWIGRSLAYVAGLPPKKPKTPQERAPAA
jgi:hypothetical protein